MSLLNRISAVEVVIVTTYVASRKIGYSSVEGGTMNLALFAVEFGSENAISSRLSLRRPRFNPGRICVGFCGGQSGTGASFISVYFSLTQSLLFHQCPILIRSSQMLYNVITSAPHSLVRKVCVCLKYCPLRSRNGLATPRTYVGIKWKTKENFPAAVVTSRSSQSYPNKSCNTIQYYITQK